MNQELIKFRDKIFTLGRLDYNPKSDYNMLHKGINPISDLLCYKGGIAMIRYIQSEELKENNRLYREMDGLYHELCVKMGLSDSAFLILYSIVEMDGNCSQREIADRCCISRKTINSSVKNLESQGYVVLESGPGRDKYIVLTERGERLVQEKIFPVMEVEDSAFQEMEPEEIRELLRLNEKYVEAFRKKAGGLKRYEDTTV